MDLEIKNYVCRPRNSKHEKLLLQWLRELPEEKRYSAIGELLQQDKKVGLVMAARTLRQKQYFEKILEQGLEEGDASTILPWLECAVPKLGFRKVILSLNRRLEIDPRSVDNALYWMPRFKPQNDPSADLELAAIRTRIQENAQNAVPPTHKSRKAIQGVQPRSSIPVLVSVGSRE